MKHGGFSSFKGLWDNKSSVYAGGRRDLDRRPVIGHCVKMLRCGAVTFKIPLAQVATAGWRRRTRGAASEEELLADRQNMQPIMDEY